MAKFLLWFKTEVRGSKEKGEFALVQYIECSPAPDNVGDVLGCVSLRGSTDDNTDQHWLKDLVILGGLIEGREVVWS